MQIVLILDNIRSIFNVGSMFRTADAFGVQEIVCGGYTPTPEHPELKKTALGAETSVRWREEAVLAAIERLRSEGYRIVALETGGESLVGYQPGSEKIAVIVGNETEGISSAALERVDARVSIPMLGMKFSLNVGVSAGIVLYAITYGV